MNVIDRQDLPWTDIESDIQPSTPPTELVGASVNADNRYYDILTHSDLSTYYWAFGDTAIQQLYDTVRTLDFVFVADIDEAYKRPWHRIKGGKQTVISAQDQVFDGQMAQSFLSEVDEDITETTTYIAETADKPDLAKYGFNTEILQIWRLLESEPQSVMYGGTVTDTAFDLEHVGPPLSDIAVEFYGYCTDGRLRNAETVIEKFIPEYEQFPDPGTYETVTDQTENIVEPIYDRWQTEKTYDPDWAFAADGYWVPEALYHFCDNQLNKKPETPHEKGKFLSSLINGHPNEYFILPGNTATKYEAGYKNAKHVLIDDDLPRIRHWNNYGHAHKQQDKGSLNLHGSTTDLSHVGKGTVRGICLPSISRGAFRTYPIEAMYYK